jgi:hypothetical protein
MMSWIGLELTTWNLLITDEIVVKRLAIGPQVLMRLNMARLRNIKYMYSKKPWKSCCRTPDSETKSMMRILGFVWVGWGVAGLAKWGRDAVTLALYVRGGMER